MANLNILYTVLIGYDTNSPVFRLKKTKHKVM